MLGDRASIADSDQGRSFQAFYDFLLSAAKQEELAELLQRVQTLPAIAEPDPRMRHIHYDWLDAGERTQATVRLLSEQLRRFLDDQVWLENRRVMDILRSIEASCAARSGTYRPVELTTEIDGVAPTVALPMERPLYRPRRRRRRWTARRDQRRRTSSTLGAVRAGLSSTRPAVADACAARCSGERRSGWPTVIAAHPLEQGLANSSPTSPSATSCSRWSSTTGQRAGHAGRTPHGTTGSPRCRRVDVRPRIATLAASDVGHDAGANDVRSRRNSTCPWWSSS